MPRYFFNVHDGQTILDREGTELADIAEARVDAVDLAGRSIHELGDKFWLTAEDWRLEVADETGKVLFTLTFSAKSGA
jgi:hypothetical protein